MLLKHFLLGALLALSSVAALPNPEADLQDVEARDDKHQPRRCGKDANPDSMDKHKCICKDQGKDFDPEHKICRCPKDQRPDRHDPHKCVLIGQFNPLTWLTKQASDILGDVFQLPDLTGLVGAITTAIGKIFDEEASNIVTLLTDVLNKFTAVFDGQVNVFEALSQLLGDAFWTLLDAIKIVLTNAVGAIPEIMTELWKVISSPIKIPIISTIWSVFMGSDTPLTILNAMTTIPSWALNIYAGTVYGKMPFDPEVFGDPTTLFPSEDQVKSWLQPGSSPRHTLKTKSRASQGAGKTASKANVASVINLAQDVDVLNGLKPKADSALPRGKSAPSAGPVHNEASTMASVSGGRPGSTIENLASTPQNGSPPAPTITAKLDGFQIARSPWHAQVNRGPGPRQIPGANNELQFWNLDYQRFEDLNQAAPAFSETLLKVFRGLVAGFVLLCCIYNFVIAIAALGEDPEAAAFVFIAFGFDAQNALACGLLYGLMTEDSHSTPKQQTSITAAANAYRTSSGKLILVTGTSDFIATHILATQQRNGYCVRGVVWSQTSGNTALKKLSENSDKLSVVIVHNMTALGAFDEAVKSMDGARKFQLSSAQLAPKMILVPAIKGTNALLESLAVHECWDDVTNGYAKAADAGTAYVAPKALAGKAAWKCMKEEKLRFDLTSDGIWPSDTCPILLGTERHHLGHESLYLWWTGRWRIQASEVPKAGNERFFIVSM
ncbi:hypothetical protein MRS44_015069 [Fusarium solani]|uniref:uncharacterized protein n=1 Tax=Fusarium solani TaxID=169388 RepID=UPI0032C3E76B|nr:hypothetical protein MRS44_015069 [Fusarium solani]